MGIPIMLRLALIENLRRVAARVAASRVHQNMADDWADRMLAIADSAPKKLFLVIADMAPSSPPMSGAFVAALARRFPGQSAALALPLTWIEQQLAELGLTMEHLVRAKSQQQAADQDCIGNGIGSLRFLGAIHWRELAESIPPPAPTLVVTPTMPGTARGGSRPRWRRGQCASWPIATTICTPVSRPIFAMRPRRCSRAARD
jgi:cyclic beta-1,2-glucan synthetase